ncbi:hypothetical protein HHK36_030599 [Tetracentron sinense]|uniref:ABC transporter domain-containing protein n=1 Tax=Tetracentron sinense TaxID=13715 RepID=A0A834YBC9_TETSI|nr:hypothetical protein HHK36_030599 [Tetracentron sinense]
MGYDYEIIYKKGTDNTTAYALSRRFDRGSLYALSQTIWDGLADRKKGYKDDPILQPLIHRLTIKNENFCHYSFHDCLVRRKDHIISIMDLASKFINLRSSFFTDPPFLDARKTSIRPLFRPISASLTQTRISSDDLVRTRTMFIPRKDFHGVSAIAVKTSTEDIESLFSETSIDINYKKRNRKHSMKGASSVCSGVRLENICKSYKRVTVLKNVNLEVKEGERVGLVGVNGAGKTTLLRIIVGQEEADSGNVIKANPNMKIAFLSQEFDVSPSRTLKEELLTAFKEEMEIAAKLEKVQKALECSVEDLELMGRLLDELDLLHRRAQAIDLDGVDAKINKLMPVLGFSPEDLDRLEPDLLLLDEPTNHLDVDTIEWLEGYLKNQDVPMIIISHDRAFLDLLCTKIVEIERGVSRTYEGNYSNFVVEKAELIEKQYADWEKQQKQIERTKDITNKLSAGASAGRASKKLQKLQEDDHQIEKPFERKQIKLRFPEHGKSGKSVLVIKNLYFGYENKELFNRANLIIQRGEKIAIIGPNGCGKSTLLRLILGLEKPRRGEVLLGEHNVLPNYFEQNQAEALDLDKTVLQTVEEVAKGRNIGDIKELLGRRNFKSDMLDRKVSLLSGGEKARLAFCKFIVKPSTLLVLDEPTNHLDVPSKEMLEEAIRKYNGTVITVSHDRYFIKQIVNRVVEIKDNNLEDYVGDYNYYLEKNLIAREQELEWEARVEEMGPKVKPKRKMSKAQKEAYKKQRIMAFRRANAKAKSLKNAKRWK